MVMTRPPAQSQALCRAKEWAADRLSRLGLIVEGVDGGGAKRADGGPPARNKAKRRRDDAAASSADSSASNCRQLGDRSTVRSSAGSSKRRATAIDHPVATNIPPKRGRRGTATVMGVAASSMKADDRKVRSDNEKNKSKKSSRLSNNEKKKQSVSTRPRRARRKH